jgi:endonuclease/exonuclease/phosphatase family metal-dependent hydrolase
VKTTTSNKWFLIGDFNLIYRAYDKSKGRINRKLMNSFRTILDDLELHLHGRWFTWTSGIADATQTKIDHIFSTREWELEHPDCHLQALGSSVSDHCPMLLNCNHFHRCYKGFRFEACWLNLPDFKQIVSDSWVQPVHS